MKEITNLKFRRIKKDSVFFGVCTGMQDLFKQKGLNVDVYLIRFIILILVIALPNVVDTIIIGSYFVAALVFPIKEEEEKELDLIKKDDENDPS